MPSVNDIVQLEEIPVTGSKRESSIQATATTLPQAIYESDLVAMGKQPTKVAKVLELFNGIYITGLVSKSLSSCGSGPYVIEQGSIAAYGVRLAPLSKAGVVLTDQDFMLYFKDSYERDNALVTLDTSVTDLVYFSCSLGKYTPEALYGTVGAATSYEWVKQSVSSGDVLYEPETAATALGLGLGINTTVGKPIAIALSGKFTVPTSYITGSPVQGDLIYNDTGAMSTSAVGEPQGQVLGTNATATILELF